MAEFIMPGQYNPAEKKTGLNEGIDNLDKIEKIADKGIKIFELLNSFMEKRSQAQQARSNIENKADKMATQQYNQMVQNTAPMVVKVMPTITFDNESAIKELLTKLEGVDAKVTVKEFIEKVKPHALSGTFNSMISEFILKHTKTEYKE